MVFTTRQAAQGEEHKLLSALRDSALKDAQARETFYQKVIGSLELEGNYLILLAHDAYDVPRRGKDGRSQGESESVFSYIVCCVCPVRTRRAELGYFPGDNEFHSQGGQIVAPPELGFLFPAFDGRAANLYNALLYTRKADELHQEFIDAVFHTEPPMSAAEQREAFHTALSDALGAACTLEAVQAVHSGLLDRIVRHKESGDPEPLEVTSGDAAAFLRDCGVEEARVEAFQARCRELLGERVLNPANLIDPKRFQIKTQSACLTVDPEQSCLAEVREIGGRRYLTVPVDGTLEVNGLGLGISRDG